MSEELQPLETGVLAALDAERRRPGPDGATKQRVLDAVAAVLEIPRSRDPGGGAQGGSGGQNAGEGGAMLGSDAEPFAPWCAGLRVAGRGAARAPS